MFEQQQNTGKSASLAEKYANAVGQLSDANDWSVHAEHDLQVERITRQDLIDEEVARCAKLQYYFEICNTAMRNGMRVSVLGEGNEVNKQRKNPNLYCYKLG